MKISVNKMSALSSNYITDWIEYLKDPLLVARFQRYFGVKLNPLDTLQKVDRQGDVELIDGLYEYDFDQKTTNNDRGSSGTLNCDDGVENDESSIPRKRRAMNQKLSKKTNLQVDEDSGISSCGSVRTESKNRWKDHVEDDCDNSDSSTVTGQSHGELVDRVVGNKFWYYLFLFGTALGDEMFYASFFSFWFWNVDGAVGRRVVMVWALVMFIGQGLKDIICWPRPSAPPVIRLETKWEKEYGMPSTHAITGAAVPFSILIFTSCRYEYPFFLGVCLALTWCTLVCTSRLYLGMHSVLDIVAGLALVCVLFLWVIPLVDWLDPIFLTHEFGALYLLVGAIFLAVCSPGGDRWTPARGDTIVILGSAVGLITGAWMNYQLGVIRGPPMDPPYAVIYPNYRMLGLSLLRLAIGLCIVVATRAVVKSASYATIKGLMQSKNVSYIANPTTREVFVELAYKFLTYMCIGFNIVWLAPTVFRLIGIERPTFHTEV